MTKWSNKKTAIAGGFLEFGLLLLVCVPPIHRLWAGIAKKVKKEVRGLVHGTNL
jgi:hypothetical protein